MEEINHTCVKCKALKLKTEFVLDKRQAQGHANVCKVCRATHKLNYARSNEDQKKKKKEYSSRPERREKHRAANAAYRKRYPERNRARKLAYVKRKYHSDLKYKISARVKGRMYDVLKGTPSPKTIELLGCSVDYYKHYIESKFQEGMTWENHSLHGWHIDHIIPLASFDLTNEEELKKAFHYTNTQPLWASENRKKHAKLDWVNEGTKNA